MILEDRSVKLIENFTTWQGEGPDSGRTMVILRFKTCNLHCPWCDTAVKMRVSGEAPHLMSDIQKTIKEKRAGILITGGEPTVGRHIEDSITLLNNLDYTIANVESNGFDLEGLIKRIDKSKNVKYIFSPKIFSFEDNKFAKSLSEKLFHYDNVYFKVVWEEGSTDMFCKWLSEVVEGTSIANRVWLMPQGATRADLIRNSERVFDACEKYKFNFSSRDHIIYGFI
jgi:7-carboxy-7-deazaguanine synthase